MCLSPSCLANAELAFKQAAQPVYLGPNPDAFTVLMAECDEEMQKILRMLAANGSVPNWADAMIQALLKYHTQAHYLGQAKWDQQMQFLAVNNATKVVHIGKQVINPRTYDTIIVPGEADYLAGFVRDLIAKDKKYFEEDGTIRLDNVLNRMRMYQGKMRGSEGIGVLEAGPVNELWKWELGGAEDHCEDCPFLASLVPVTRDEWFSTPGAGDTQCLFGCRCKFVAVKSGVTMADPIERRAA